MKDDVMIRKQGKPVRYVCPYSDGLRRKRLQQNRPRRARTRRDRLRGSFTVEAAFLFPILILLTAFVLQTAISLYEGVDQASAAAEELEETDGTELFWNAVRLKELKEEILHED